MRVRSPLVLLAFALPVAAQQTQSTQSTSDFRWEKTLAAGAFVSLHNINGDVVVLPSTNGKVEVLGVRRGRGRDAADVTLEVVESSRGITVCAMYKYRDMECSESGIRTFDNGRRGWGSRDWDDAEITIEVKLPKGMEVDARSVSGDVSITGAEGRVRGTSVSGNVRLERLRATTSVRAGSTSGDVIVQIESLAGEGILSFTSVSGNVTAELPKDLNADISMRSVSGSLDSDFPLTLNGRVSRNTVEARIGKGGRELEVRTVSGDVRLRTARP